MHRFSLVAGLEDEMALRLERMAQHRAQRILVFDKENREGGYRSHQACVICTDCLSSSGPYHWKSTRTASESPAMMSA